MCKEKRRWVVNGDILKEYQALVRDINDHLQRETLYPLNELFDMMRNNGSSYGSLMGSAGRIGSLLVFQLSHRLNMLCDLLREKGVSIEVVPANDKAPDFDTGEVLQINILKDGEAIA